jgi:hypothetical protein
MRRINCAGPTCSIVVTIEITLGRKGGVAEEWKECYVEGFRVCKLLITRKYEGDEIRDAGIYGNVQRMG